ncbi:hypothetical protein B0I37DRAFT_31737 [Chaetomium sp. MPI-CAGE-AT-0009]|nr:hypothetical protein B0I37DRAFT_31737 [Chaetomium sp. MPI-CAGE-AT-0009]
MQPTAAIRTVSRRGLVYRTLPLFHVRCDMSLPICVSAEPENSRDSADSTTGGIQLHTSQFSHPKVEAVEESERPAVGDSQASSTTPSEGTRGPRTARRFAFTWWVNVPSVQWYFRGHGRTSPDLELCANRCAILHLRNPPISCCLSTSPQTCRQGSQAPVGQSRRGLCPPGPGPCHIQARRRGHGMGSRPASQSSDPPPLRPLRR